MVARRFGAAGDRVVLEECLVGPEVSYFVLSDGRSFVPMSSAQDHKRIFDGDRGPNTGGMGAFAPSPLLTPDLERQVVDQVVAPVIDGMAAEGTPFAGFLYVGLMLTAQGPKVIEFNVRFGDPEAQVVLPMLEGQPRGVADGRGDGRPARPARPVPRRAARRRGGGGARLSRHAGNRQGRFSALDAAGVGSRRARVSRRHRRSRRRRGDGRRPRADRGGPRAVVSRRHRHGVPGRQPRALRRHAVPHRHRPQGDSADSS